MEQRDGARRLFTRVFYDRGRFRVEHLREAASNKADVVELRDDPGAVLVWSYSQSSDGNAYPYLLSSLAALGREAKRLGEDRARQLYGIPKSVHINPSQEPYQLPLLAAAQLIDEKPAWQDAGLETISGIKCRVRTRRVTPPNPGVIIRTPDTVEWNPVMDLRISVDPETGLALRYERRDTCPPPSPVPPSVSGYTVKSFRRLDRQDARLFQLPPGATANVPLIFAKAQLPKGVRRVPMTGAFAGIGIDYSRRK